MAIVETGDDYANWKGLERMPSEREWWEACEEITDDMVERSRAGIGQEGPIRNQWNEAVTRDTLFHAAVGFGDDNPLWIDAEYAARSKWGRRLAPTSFIQSLIYGTRLPLDAPTGPKKRSVLAGMAGIGGYTLGQEISWQGPLREGDQLRVTARKIACIDSQGDVPGDRLPDVTMRLSDAIHSWEKLVGGWPARTVLEVAECRIWHTSGALAATVIAYSVRLPRGLSVENGPYAHVQPRVYTAGELEEILRSYTNETRRGAEPLYFEDVVVGVQLPARIRGPLTVTGMRAYAAAVGSNFAMGDGLLFRYLSLSPGANCPHPDTNVPDIPNRIHWDTDLANTIGMPFGYDIGPMRLHWFGSYLTDWIGDSAYLRHLGVFYPAPLFLGDTLRLTAHVSGSREDETEPAVDFELQGVNGANEIVTVGYASAVVERRPSQVSENTGASKGP